MEREPNLEELRRLQSHLEQREEELGQVKSELREAREKITRLQGDKNHVVAPAPKPREPNARATAVDLFSIMVASLAVGLLFNVSNPNGVVVLPESLFRPTPPLVNAAEVKRSLAEDGAVLVDARPVEFYREGHIEGAVNLPPSLFDIIYRMKLSHLDPQRSLIVYGRTISRHYDEEVAHLLRERDREVVKVFPGGLSAWAEAGYPIER